MGPPGREGPPGPLGPVGPVGPAGPRGNTRERWSLTRLPPLFYTGWDCSAPYKCKSEHYRNGKLFPVSGGVTPTLSTVPAKCKTRNMAGHLLHTAQSQQQQKEALEALVENTRQREFDKLFDAIPLYDEGKP